MVPLNSCILQSQKIEVPKILGQIKMPRPGKWTDRKFVVSRHPGVVQDHDYGTAKDRDEVSDGDDESPKRKRVKKDVKDLSSKAIELGKGFKQRPVVSDDDENVPLLTAAPKVTSPAPPEKSSGLSISSSSTSDHPITSLTGTTPSSTSSCSSCSCSSYSCSSYSCPSSSCSSSSSSAPFLLPAAIDIAAAVEAALRPLWTKVNELQSELKTVHQENSSLKELVTKLHKGQKRDLATFNRRVNSLETWAEEQVIFCLYKILMSITFCFVCR